MARGLHRRGLLRRSAVPFGDPSRPVVGRYRFLPLFHCRDGGLAPLLATENDLEIGRRARFRHRGRPLARGPGASLGALAIIDIFYFHLGPAQVREALNGGPNGRLSWQIPVGYLHSRIARGVEVVGPGRPPEKAIYQIEFFSATGTAILVAAVAGGWFMGYRPRQLALFTRAPFAPALFAHHHRGHARARLRDALRGTDATLGLALARTGPFYPFFGTLLGWLGVALTGSDTASNVLFGSLQTITAGQLVLSPVLMAAANTSGGGMGKMLAAQSIVVASTATNWDGHEGKILRFVLFHSLALAALMGLFVWLQSVVSTEKSSPARSSLTISLTPESNRLVPGAR